MVYSTSTNTVGGAIPIATSTSGPVDTTTLLLYFGVIFVIALIFIAAVWRIYSKAGRPGWASIVPFYNTYVLLKICGMSGWWYLALLVPIVNIIVTIMIAIKLAKSFGRGWLFAALWLVLFPIGYLILGFGKAQYLGPGGAMAGDGPHAPTPEPPQMPQAAPGVQPMQPPMPASPVPPAQPVVQQPTQPTPPPAPAPMPSTPAPSIDTMGPPPAPPKPGSVVYPPGQEPPAPPQ